MKSRALRVPREEGERTRLRLREVSALRDDLQIVDEGRWILLPLSEGKDPPATWGEVVVADFREALPRGPQDYRELLEGWSPTMRAEAPRAFDVIGDVVLVRLPPSLTDRGEEIGRALLAFVPGARLVGADLGVHGEERRRAVERLAGTGPWRTVHRENGLAFDVDLERAYFSPRLAGEHARVADAVRPADRVYDLCCGVGPFAVTIAAQGRARAVTAVDLNSSAIELLRATLARYPFGGTVRPVEAPIEQFLDGAMPVEVAVLNLPHEGIKYLTSVANVVVPGGRIFYYEMTDRGAGEAHDMDLLRRLGGSPSWTIRDRRVAHPYSPSSDLVAFTFERAAA